MFATPTTEIARANRLRPVALLRIEPLQSQSTPFRNFANTNIADAGWMGGRQLGTSLQVPEKIREPSPLIVSFETL